MTEDSLPDGSRQDGLPRGESNSTVASLGTIHGSRSNEPLVNGWTKAKPVNGVSTQPAEVRNDIQLSGAGPPAIVDDDDQGGPCGWCGFYPNFLQRFRSPRWVLFFLCWAGALQGLIVNGFVNVVITTIERRYHLNSKESGLIAGGYDIASFLCLIPVSYFGASRRKPLLIGQGVLILALGSFVFSIPHFASSKYSFLFQDKNTCNMNDDDTCSSSAQQSESKLTNFKYVFLLGQLLHGTGAAPFYTLGCTYLDENVSTKMSSVYIGIYYTMAIIGPAAGYILGGQFLKIYVDLDVPESLSIEQNSTVWVGAWWLGFVLAAAIGLIVAIPLSAFPKTLPGSKKIRALKVPEMHQKLQDSAVAESSFGTTLRDLPKSLKYLICNPTFLFLSLAGASEGMLVSGLATFLPKIIESQFSIAASSAALYVGLVTVPGAGGGTFLGGYLVKKLKLRCSGIIRMCIIFSSICLCFGLVFLLSCPAPAFSGVNHDMRNESFNETNRFARECNIECGCSRFRYDPVCSYDNVIYFSPCYAGCKNEYTLDGAKVYDNCSCVAHPGESRNLSDSSTVMIQAKREKCNNVCNHLPVFLLLIFMCMTFTFLVSMPSLSATLRCVADSQKSFALGIQWMTVRLLGTIPAPILFGFLIDSSCSLWDKKCEEKGSCLFYNNKLMNQNTLILACILKSLSTIYFFFAWFLYRPPKDGEESESDERTDKVPVENGSYQMNPALKTVET